MVKVAVFDAVNAVIGGYTPYALRTIAPGASAEAAAAMAAYTVSASSGPNGLTALDSALAATLASVPDGPPNARRRLQLYRKFDGKNADV
ncbi:MAG: hypothetical protein ACKV19_24235 [Verrucomicrobiales bacterium]